MKIDTLLHEPIDAVAVVAYIDSLINRFFKILPMRENGEASVDVYIRSFQCELLGCQNLIPVIGTDKSYLTLLSILQYLADNPECPVSDVKREIFRAIGICDKLKTSLDTEAQNERLG